MLIVFDNEGPAGKGHSKLEVFSYDGGPVSFFIPSGSERPDDYDQRARSAGKTGGARTVILTRSSARALIDALTKFLVLTFEDLDTGDVFTIVGDSAGQRYMAFHRSDGEKVAGMGDGNIVTIHPDVEVERVEGGLC